MAKRCIVCAGDVAEPHFANAWERSLGRNACCSPSCAERFNPDEHWIPADRPRPASDDEHDRLLAVTRERLTNGDEPRTVIREMLQAGVPVASLRKVVFFSSVEASESKLKAQELTAWSSLWAIVGVFQAPKRRDPRDVQAHEVAQADLDAWEAAFPEEGGL